MSGAINKHVREKLPDPHNLYFCFHRLDDTIFIHRKPNGTYTKKKGFEGAAFVTEKTADELLKEDPFLMRITVAEMSKVLPVFLNFPAGHPLAEIQIQIVNGEVDFNPKLNRVK